MTYIFNILHLMGAIAKNTYGFFSRPVLLYDSFYLFFFTGVPLSWLVCKGECVFSYLYKKYENPQYILGSDSHNYSDLAQLFPNKSAYKIYSHISAMAMLGSFILVNNRTRIIPLDIFIPLSAFLAFYLWDIELFSGYHIDLFYPGFHVILGYYLANAVYLSFSKLRSILSVH